MGGKGLSSLDRVLMCSCDSASICTVSGDCERRRAAARISSTWYGSGLGILGMGTSKSSCGSSGGRTCAAATGVGAIIGGILASGVSTFGGGEARIVRPEAAISTSSALKDPRARSWLGRKGCGLGDGTENSVDEAECGGECPFDREGVVGAGVNVRSEQLEGVSEGESSGFKFESNGSGDLQIGVRISSSEGISQGSNGNPAPTCPFRT